MKEKAIRKIFDQHLNVYTDEGASKVPKTTMNIDQKKINLRTASDSQKNLLSLIT